MVPNPAPIGTGSFISHQRMLDPPEITIFAGSSITRGRTGHRRDEDSSGLGPSNDDCDVGEGDGQSWKMSNLLHGPESSNQILPRGKRVNCDIFSA